VTLITHRPRSQGRRRGPDEGRWVAPIYSHRFSQPFPTIFFPTPLTTFSALIDVASRHCGNLSIFWKIQKTTQGSGKKTHGKFLPSGVSFSSVCLHVALCVFGVCILCVYCVCASWRRERLFFSCCCRDMDTRKMVGLSATRMPPVSYSHGRTRRTREVTSLGHEKKLLSIVTLRRLTLI